MSFFENTDVRGIVSDHIDKLLNMEEEQSREIIRIYQRIRGQLSDRLSSLPADTFTAQRLRGVLAQVEGAIVAMTDNLTTFMLGASRQAGLLGASDLITEIDEFNEMFTGAVIPIDLDNVAVSLNANNFLVNKYEASIDAYSQGVRSTITSGLTQAAIEEISYGETIRRVNNFLHMEEWKLHRIVRTELHTVYNVSKQIAMKDIKKQYIPDLKKTLFHPIDSRTGDDSKQAKIANLIVEIDKPFVYNYTRRLKDGSVVKEERVFMTPPDRPNDRSIMVPFREEWDQ